MSLAKTDSEMEDDDQQQRIIAGVTDLMERIGHLRREMDGLRAKKENLASMASAARKTWSSCKEEGSLEDDVAKVTAEIKVMRSSVPEGRGFFQASRGRPEKKSGHSYLEFSLQDTPRTKMSSTF